jgi:hypothetical protein
MTDSSTPPPAWGAQLALPGVAPAFQARLDALGRALAARFDAQFAGRLADAHFILKAAQFARYAIAELCWPAPALRPPLRQLGRPMTLRAPQRLVLSETAPWLSPLPLGVAYDNVRGEFSFAGGAALAEFVSGLVRRVREDAFRIAPEAAEETVEIPSRLAELERLWFAAPRTRPLARFAEAISAGLPPGVVPILFGSLAEPPPWPAYADVDLAFYLGDEAFAPGSDWLGFVESFRRQIPQLLAADPAQHHGPYILTAADLRVYPRAFLPLETLRHAATLTGAPLKLRLAPLAEDRIFALEALVGTWRGLRHLAARAPRSFQDRYTAKFFSSLVLLAPALFCGCLGRPLDKAASFELFKNELNMDASSIETIEIFERFRRDWRWTLSPPRRLLNLSGSRATWLARTWNRWPCPATASQLGALAPKVDPLFEAMLERLFQDQG